MAKCKNKSHKLGREIGLQLIQLLFKGNYELQKKREQITYDINKMYEKNCKSKKK